MDTQQDPGPDRGPARGKAMLTTRHKAQSRK